MLSPPTWLPILGWPEPSHRPSFLNQNVAENDFLILVIYNIAWIEAQVLPPLPGALGFEVLSLAMEWSVVNLASCSRNLQQPRGFPLGASLTWAPPDPVFTFINKDLNRVGLSMGEILPLTPAQAGSWKQKGLVNNLIFPSNPTYSVVGRNHLQPGSFQRSFFSKCTNSGEKSGERERLSAPN